MSYPQERIDRVMPYLNRLLEGLRLADLSRAARRHRRAQSDQSSIQDVLGSLEILQNDTESTYSYSITPSDVRSARSSPAESTTHSTASQGPYSSETFKETLIEGILPRVSWEFFVNLLDETGCVFHWKLCKSWSKEPCVPVRCLGLFTSSMASDVVYSASPNIAR